MNQVVRDDSRNDALTIAGSRTLPLLLQIETDLSQVAFVWRAFEQDADCTAFQTFAWQSAWMTHVGSRKAVTPAIVIGRAHSGKIVFIFPLAVHDGVIRYLTWLAGDLCDYNGPLLAPDFAKFIGPANFLDVWREILHLLKRRPELRHDAVVLDKMTETIGEQANPFLQLGVDPTPTSGYLSHLNADWQSFYTAKRSRTTRQRDRSKRKKIGKFGEVRYVTPQKPKDILDSLDALFAQKSKSLSRIGAANLFAKPGIADFFRAVATDRTAPGFAHVSRLDVGDDAAAANFGLIFRDRYFHILMSYCDGPMSRFGPGSAHLHEIMQFAIGRGCNVFDFTIGDEAYKLHWADSVLTLHDHRSAMNVKGQVATSLSKAFMRVKRTVKLSPVLSSLFNAIRARVGFLKGSFHSASAESENDTEPLDDVRPKASSKAR